MALGKKIENVNKEYYDDLYKKKNLFFQILHPFISFDQQSKSKLNYRTIKSIIRQQNRNTNFTFLDYGFGHGSLILKIPRQKGLFGCDISMEAVRNFPQVAKVFGKNVKTFLPQQLSGQVTKFDIISLSHVLEHVEDDLLLLRELSTFLAPNGYILINVPVNEVWEDPKHIRKYTSLSLRKLLENVGLSIKSIEEKDKWSAFFLINEKVNKCNRVKFFLLKACRLLLALLPVSLLESSERMLGDKYKRQQLIVLAQKNG